MNGRPSMPVPQREMTPNELCREMEEWAVQQGYTYSQTRARGESWKVFVRDPKGGYTYTTVPKAHHG